jgi:branched-chain amino acid transport system substrate-binding protein
VKRNVVLLKVLALGASASVILVGCSSSGSSTQSSGSAATGSSASASSGGAVTIGFLTSLTGAVASSFADSVKGAQARVNYQNAHGGVNGKKITLVVADDGSSPTQAHTAGQILVSKGAAVVASVSIFVSGAEQYFRQQNIPVVGGPWSGPEWGTPGNENMFGDEGSYDVHTPAFTGLPTYMKQAGTTKFGVVSVNSPSSAIGGKAIAYAANHEGLPVVYQTSSVALGATDLSSTAIAMKDAGVNGFYSAMDGGANVSLAKALNQIGYHPKVALYGNGYGQNLLTDPTLNKVFQNAYFTNWLRPLDLGGAGISTLKAAMSTEGITGIPDFGEYEGYIAADAAIAAVQSAGSDPTSANIMTDFRKVTNYDAGGLLAQPVDFATDFGLGGIAPQINTKGCFYVTQLVGTTFKTDPTIHCGTQIPNSNQS